MKHFFIYSLPRSGSAWLSQFLSQPGSFCYHEPLADWPDGFLDKLEARPEPCTGAIDTSAYNVNIGFSKDWKVFALHRPLGEIRLSSEKLGFCVNWDNAYTKFRAKVDNVEVIQYHLLSDIVYLRDLWHRVVGKGFDQERTEYLMEMNIQRSVNSVIARLRGYKA